MNTTVEIQEVVDRLRQCAGLTLRLRRGWPRPPVNEDYSDLADELLALGFRLEKEPHK